MNIRLLTNLLFLSVLSGLWSCQRVETQLTMGVQREIRVLWQEGRSQNSEAGICANCTSRWGMLLWDDSVAWDKFKGTFEELVEGPFYLDNENWIGPYQSKNTGNWRLHSHYEEMWPDAAINSIKAEKVILDFPKLKKKDSFRFINEIKGSQVNQIAIRIPAWEKNSPYSDLLKDTALLSRVQYWLLPVYTPYVFDTNNLQGQNAVKQVKPWLDLLPLDKTVLEFIYLEAELKKGFPDPYRSKSTKGKDPFTEIYNGLLGLSTEWAGVAVWEPRLLEKDPKKLVNNEVLVGLEQKFMPAPKPLFPLVMLLALALPFSAGFSFFRSHNLRIAIDRNAAITVLWFLVLLLPLAGAFAYLAWDGVLPEGMGKGNRWMRTGLRYLGVPMMMLSAFGLFRGGLKMLKEVGQKAHKSRKGLWQRAKPVLALAFLWPFYSNGRGRKHKFAVWLFRIALLALMAYGYMYLATPVHRFDWLMYGFGVPVAWLALLLFFFLVRWWDRNVLDWEKGKALAWGQRGWLKDAKSERR